MRDVLLVGAFIPMFVMAMRHTWVGVLLWTWLSLMNPHRLTYGFANTMPFAAAAAGATLLSLLWNRGLLRIPRDAAFHGLLAFIVWMCVTTVFAIYPEGSLPDLERVLKILLMAVLAAVAIRERKHIEYFIWVTMGSLAFYGIKGGIFTIASGGSSRVWGPAGSMVEGNNEMGLALVMIIPLAAYLRMVAKNKWVRRGLLLGMLLSAAGVLGTQSRGAFLAITAMGLVLWVRSPQKAVGGVVILLAAVLLVAFMPESWEVRMRSIGSYQADASAQGRINAWMAAFNIANDRITGGGFLVETREVFGLYAPDPDTVFTAHSIYFQALGEQGWIGLLLFLGVGAMTFRDTMYIRRHARERADTQWLYHLAGMIQVSMVGYAVGGAFLSLTYFDLPYNILVIAVAGRAWLAEKRWTLDTEGAFGATTPNVQQRVLAPPSTPSTAGASSTTSTTSG